jgi:predicted Zn-dependent protease
MRGEAYLMLHDGSRAAAEFQKFIDHRGVVANFPWGALARLGLARAYALQGHTAKARTAYKDFLTLWKDADPDVPILKEAQTEYDELKENDAQVSWLTPRKGQVVTPFGLSSLYPGMMSFHFIW